MDQMQLFEVTNIENDVYISFNKNLPTYAFITHHKIIENVCEKNATNTGKKKEIEEAEVGEEALTI